jgi:nicotinamidase-related amidase
MSEPVWNKFLTERDKQVFGAAGYGIRAGFGKRPALLVIDVSYAFCGDKPEPILESIKRWRNSCGDEAWAGIAQIKRLIDKAHDKALPVIYTTGVRRADNWDAGGWARKNSRNGEAPKTGSNRDGYDIIDEIAPGPKDLVIYKQKPSGFFATPMSGYLTQLQCDSVVITGRRRQVASRNRARCVQQQLPGRLWWKTAVSTRSRRSHAITLCDMNAKSMRRG